MNILKPIILLLSFLYITGCATVGPTIVIETDKPAEDFVVVCQKAESAFFDIGHGGRNIVDDKVIVTDSGKEVGCGLMLGGIRGSVSVMHPIYVMNRDKSYKKDGVEHIVFNKTKLDLLDEQKAKFEAGYWDKFPNPGFKYANNVSGCGISFSYLDIYSKAKIVNKSHFKSLYDKDMRICLAKLVGIYKAYRPKSSNQYTTGDAWADAIWNSDKWSRYK